MQRYFCNRCSKYYSAEQPLPGVRIETNQAVQVIALLCEGNGIRAIARLTSLDQGTVLNILESAGQKCADLLDSKIQNVEVESVQADELWSFVHCKQANNVFRNPEFGDAYTFLGVDRKSKLILSHRVGKRDYANTLCFIQDLKKRVSGRFQLTSDQFQGYVRAVYNTFYGDIDFAQQQKVFTTSTGGEIGTARRYSPPAMIKINTMVHIGNPIPERISTSHVERTNLSIRLFNRRYTRLTLGYSKKLANLKHSLAILIAHFNFCRVHSAHGKTPAQAAGLTDRRWTIEDLIRASI